MDIHEEEYKGFKIRIVSDESPSDPRAEWDNAGTMVCFHRRYDLGDGKVKGKEHFASPKDFDNWWKEHGCGGILIPLYLYDHGGITMSAGRGSNTFADQWDSGQVGYIFATRDTILKEWGKGNRVSKKARVAAEKYLRGEIDAYDHYLTGAVYGYVLETADGEHVDSCYGYYEDWNKYPMEEAKRAADYAHAEQWAAALDVQARLDYKAAVAVL